jgi:hypothetical protein
MYVCVLLHARMYVCVYVTVYVCACVACHTGRKLVLCWSSVLCAVGNFPSKLRPRGDHVLFLFVLLSRYN